MTTTMEDRSFIVRLTQLAYLLFGLLEALIGLRVLLKLIAANPNSPFAVFIYNLSYMFVWPFTGLTRTPAAAGMVLEIPSIIAMLVYALAAWAVVKLIWIMLDRPRDTSVVYQTKIVREAAPAVPTALPAQTVSTQTTRTQTTATPTNVWIDPKENTK